MPVSISVSSDFEKIATRLDSVMIGQLPYATARALTDTAQVAQRNVSDAMSQIFDRPVPFTVKSIAIRPASKQKLEALVFVKDQQAKYLLPEQIGGERTPSMNTNKPDAQALIIPSKISLNAYGNVPYGALKRMFTAMVKAATGKPVKRKAGSGNAGVAHDRGFFYMAGHGPGGKGPGGVFKRMAGHGLQRMVSFEGVANYRPRFNFPHRVRFAAVKVFHGALSKRIAEFTRH